MKSDWLKFKKNKLNVTLTLIFYEDEGGYIIYSPALELYAYGDTMKEADQAMEETVYLFFDHLIEENTFEKELRRLKWLPHRYFKSQYAPPKYNPLEIMPKKGINNFTVKTNQELDLQLA